MARKVATRSAGGGKGPPATASKKPAKTAAKPPRAAKRTSASKVETRVGTSAPKRPRPSRPKTASPARKTAGQRRVVPSRAEDALAVEAMNRLYYDAFQKLSVDEVARLWWHDDSVACIHPGWDVRHGWMEVLSSYAEIFENTQLIRFALGDVRVHVAGDLAIVSCIENLVSEEADSSDYMGAVLATNIFERRRGEWRLLHHHASPFAPDNVELPEGPMH